MGTRLDVVLTGIPRDEAEAVAGRVFDRIRELESTLSRFRPDGETGRLNRLAAAAPVTVSPFLRDLLVACRRFHDGTDGAFDIALTPLLRRHRLPENERTDDNLREALAASGTDRIVVDPQGCTVRFAHPATEIDFGAVGKGIALDAIRPMLVEAGIANALVSFGESSILALGRHPYGEHWEIGIRHPVTDAVAHTVRLRDTALSVSGLRRITHDNVTDLQGHIVEPGTGRLVARPVTVAVSSGSAFEAEVLSTALIAAGTAAPGFLHRFPGVECHTIDATTPEHTLLS